MRFWASPNFLAAIAFLVFSVFALKSLAKDGFYTSHDGETHIARIAQYWQGLVDGQIPPRHAATFYNGFGSPIFVYIYPLPYLTGSLIHFLGFSFDDSFKILMAAGFVLSGFFCYLWFSQLFKNRQSAFLGALFYAWIPYRFLLIYVRGSLSEILAYTFLPLSLYFLTKLADFKNARWLAFSSLSLAAILLSQNLVAAIGLPTIALYVIFLAVFKKSVKYLLLCAVSFIWGLAIAAFTYAPTFFERKYVRFDEIINIAFSDHFVTLKQLIRSPWGYGFDLPGTAMDQISFQIGLAHLLVVGISVIILAFKLISLLKVKNSKSFPLFLETSMAILFLITFSAAVFLMIDSKPTMLVWNKLKFMATIDLPWRFLGICALATSFLASYVAKYIRAGILFLFLIALVLVANRNHLRINQQVFKSDDFFLNYIGTATQYNEFTPIWRQSVSVPAGFSPNIKVEKISGDLEIDNVISNSRKLVFNARVATEDAVVRVNKFYFPKTHITNNNQKLALQNGFTIKGSNSPGEDQSRDFSGLLIINLQNGANHVEVEYKETTLRLMANFLSLISFALAVGLILKNVKT